MKGGGHILVIDDEKDVRAIVAGALQDAGYEVSQAPNGAAGLELQRRSPAAVVVTDILMPEKEGLETIRDLRREFPDVKIIAMSGGSRRIKEDGHLEVAKEIGAERVLRKPFDSDELIDAVRSLMDGKG